MAGMRTSLVAMALLVAAAGGGTLPSRAAEDLLWPSRVHRIDPLTQSYERLPDRERATTALDNPGSFRLTGFFCIHDSVSFTYKAKRYRLADVRPIPNDQICTRGDGSRWACGLEARTALQKLIGSKAARCRPVAEGEALTTVSCAVAGKDIAAQLVAQGFALTGSRH